VMYSLEVPKLLMYFSFHWTGSEFISGKYNSEDQQRKTIHKEALLWLDQGIKQIHCGTRKSICVVKRATSIQGQQADRVRVRSKLLKKKKKKNNRIKSKKRIKKLGREKCHAV
jgi:hypothetical protein